MFCNVFRAIPKAKPTEYSSFFSQSSFLGEAMELIKGGASASEKKKRCTSILARLCWCSQLVGLEARAIVVVFGSGTFVFFLCSPGGGVREEAVRSVERRSQVPGDVVPPARPKHTRNR